MPTPIDDLPPSTEPFAASIIVLFGFGIGAAAVRLAEQIAWFGTRPPEVIDKHAELWEILERRRVDMVLLNARDIGRYESLALIQDIRQRSDTGIVLCNADENSRYRALALRLGADNIVNTDDDALEFQVRLEATARLVIKSSQIAKFDHYTLSLSRGQIKYRNAVVNASKTEYLLLAALIRAGGGLVSYRDLIQSVWGIEVDKYSKHMLIQTVGRLRHKLVQQFGLLHPPIATEPRWGLRLEPSVMTKPEDRKTSAAS